MSLTQQIEAVLNGNAQQAGGSLYNYDPSTAGAKKRSHKKKAVTLNEAPNDKSLVLNAGCTCSKAGAQLAAPIAAGRRKRVAMTDEQKAQRRAGAANSAWIAHIKKVANENKISYGDAMRVAGKTFKK